MSMAVVVTRNVSDRVRGFLRSSMLEMAPGVYSGARISPAVRERIWGVLEDWFVAERDASIVMIWSEPQKPGGQDVKMLGEPPIDLIELDGLVLARRNPGSTGETPPAPENPDNILDF